MATAEFSQFAGILSAALSPHHLSGFEIGPKSGFNGTLTTNFQMFKLDLEKAEEPEIKLPISTGSSKKQEFQKNIYFCFIDYTKPLTVWITTNCGKILKEMGIPDPRPAS